jgi:hypothetical protein
MSFTLTIVSTNKDFIQSAHEVFTRYPDIRITTTCDISEHAVYIFPSDAYGNLYSKALEQDHRPFIEEHWKRPRYITHPVWYVMNDTISIISPCLNLGLFVYAEGSHVPYEAMSSCLILVRNLSAVYPIKHIIIPALCCEPGGIDPEISSLQMCQAWTDFIQSVDDTVDKTHPQFVDSILVQK